MADRVRKNMRETFNGHPLMKALDRLKAGGVLTDLNVYLHPDLNTQDSYDNGTLYLVVDYGRYSPNEHTVLEPNVNEAIVSELVEDVVNG